MTSIHAPLEKADALAPVKRFLSRRASWIPVFAALALLVVIFVAAQAYFGNFLTPRVISALLLDNAYLFILAVGMTFVILTGGIDLSVGAVMAFTGMFGASLLREGMPSGIVVPLMLLLGATFGLLIGVLVQYFDVQPFIASLAAMFAARGLAFMVSLDSIKVTTPEILWLQSTRIQGAPAASTSPRRESSRCSPCSSPPSCSPTRGSAAPSTRSAATSSRRDSWASPSCGRSCSPTS